MYLNDKLIRFSGEDNIEEKEKEALALMKPVAEKYFADRKANPDIEELHFFYESKNVSYAISG